MWLHYGCTLLSTIFQTNKISDDFSKLEIEQTVFVAAPEEYDIFVWKQTSASFNQIPEIKLPLQQNYV